MFLNAITSIPHTQVFTAGIVNFTRAIYFFKEIHTLVQLFNGLLILLFYIRVDVNKQTVNNLLFIPEVATFTALPKLPA